MTLGDPDATVVSWLDAALWCDRDLVADVVDAVAAEGLLPGPLLADMLAGPPEEAEESTTALALLRRSGLTAEQLAGRFTENLGGILVLPDQPRAEWVPAGSTKPATVLRVHRRDVGRVRWLPADSAD